MILGFAFGPNILVGFLPGALVSGVQMAISASNTGGAWDNAKKYIESGAMVDDNGDKVIKGSNIHKAAVVGDTVGDPLKDTSGPALNILIKLMAILSLIFASKFADIHPQSVSPKLASFHWLICIMRIDNILFKISSFIIININLIYYEEMGIFFWRAK